MAESTVSTGPSGSRVAKGDEVDVGGTRVQWHYPPPEVEADKRWNWPTGFGSWNSTVDGIKSFKPIETPDPTAGLSSFEVDQRMADLVPAVLRRLLGPNA